MVRRRWRRTCLVLSSSSCNWMRNRTGWGRRRGRGRPAGVDLPALTDHAVVGTELRVPALAAPVDQVVASGSPALLLPIVGPTSSTTAASVCGDASPAAPCAGRTPGGGGGTGAVLTAQGWVRR